MKISFHQFVLLALCCGMAYAHDANGQNILEKSISLQAEGLRFKRVLSLIEDQADVQFVYSSSAIDTRQRVSLKVSNKKLDQVLRELLQPLSVDFSVMENRIILKSAAPVQPDENKQVSRDTSLPEEGVDKTIRGKVTDENAGTLPGVNILLKGTQQGTTTDAEGRFSIGVPDENAVLVFSFVGYVSQEMVVANRTSLDVLLVVDEKSLEEIIVVGYGTQRKENLTGAVSTVDSKSLENRPVSNLANALQGLSPGLNVTRQFGQPGEEGLGIQIRGVTSANGDVAPLIVLDGVPSPGVTMQSINPNDVESISILKDAAAASIYGAQAAGGVILITTKRGQKGKTVFEYSGLYGVDWALNIPKRIPTWEEAEYSNLARANSGAGLEYAPETIEILKEGVLKYRIHPSDSTRYQYFSTESAIDQLVRKYTAMQTHNLSARGGNGRINYLISLGYYNKQGVFKIGPDKYDRYSGRLNLGAQLTENLSLDTRISYTLQEQEAASTSPGGEGGLLGRIYRERNINPVFTPEGRYNAESDLRSYAILESGGFNHRDQNYFDGVFTLKYANLIKGLQLRGVYGVQYRRTDIERFNRTVERWWRTKRGPSYNDPNSYILTNELSLNKNLQFLADYDFRLGEKNSFHLLAGYQFEDNRFQSLSAGASNLVSNDLPALGLGDDRTKTNSQNVATNAFQSVFGRFNYNHADRYLLEATIRIDESSRLAPGLRTQTFPSVSAGWNLHREDWLSQSLHFVSELKVRGSWGRLGNAYGIGNYDYLALLTRGADLVLGSPETRSPYFWQSTVPSVQLSWETVETSNAGLDLGLFKNKLQASADYYVKYNRNMLTPQQLSAVFGVAAPVVNNGQLKSWGWETELKYRDQIGKDFNYNIAVNLSDNQNKLLSYAGRRVISIGTVRILEGYPINTLWGYRTNGYFQTADEAKEWIFQDTRTGAGDIRYMDQDGDGRLTVGRGSTDDHGDLVYLGTTQPRLLFGFTLGMSWKGFDLTTFIQGVAKRNFMPNQQALNAKVFNWVQPLELHRDYWTPENPNALFPRPYLQGTHNYLPSDKWILNARYARLKNVQLGYTLPAAVASRLRLTRARIFFSGQDLFTISDFGKFKGFFDPEQRNGVVSDYPFFATAAFGLNLSF